MSHELLLKFLQERMGVSSAAATSLVALWPKGWLCTDEATGRGLYLVQMPLSFVTTNTEMEE